MNNDVTELRALFRATLLAEQPLDGATLTAADLERQVEILTVNFIAKLQEDLQEDLHLMDERMEEEDTSIWDAEDACFTWGVAQSDGYDFLSDDDVPF